MRGVRGVRLAAVASVLLLAACAGQDAASPDPGPDLPPVAADEVALRMEHLGPLGPPQELATTLPSLTVYGDGRVVTEGPQIAIYPAPALPNVQVQRISVDDVRRLVGLAISAGVDPATDPGLPSNLVDASSTRFTIRTGDGLRSVTAYALQEAAGRPDLTAELTGPQRTARTALEGLVADLTDLPGTLGEDAVSQTRPYPATGLAAVAEPWRPPPDDEPLGDPGELAWPGPDLPGEVHEIRGLDVPCVAVTGDDAIEVLAAAASANDRTVWTSGGERWQLRLRPLLPDESGCADLLQP